MPSNLTSGEGLWTSAGGRISKPKKSRGNVAKERLNNQPDSDDAGSVPGAAGKSAAIGIPGGVGAGPSSSPSPTIQSHNSLDSGHGSLSETAPISPAPLSAAAKKGLFARIKKVSLTTGPNTALDPFQFEGEGLQFKAKLIGIRDVEAARGDDMCQAAIVELNKALKTSKEHKPRVTVAVAMSGLKIKDEKDATVLHHHTVPKISYIWRDHSDLRSFGYVCGTPDIGHKFYALKADKSADALVGAIHRLFQLAFKMKQVEIEHRKAQTLATGSDTDSGNFFDETAKKTDTNANGQSSENSSQANEANLLDLESELQVLSQGIAQMNTMQSSVPSASSGEWADFGSEAASFSGQAEVGMSSASSTSSSQSDPWGRGGTPQSQRTITPDPFDTVGATAASLASSGVFALQAPPVMPRSVPQPPVPLPAVDPFGFASVPYAAPVPTGNPFADPVNPFVPSAHSDLASIPLAPVEQYVSVFDQPPTRPPPVTDKKPDPFMTGSGFNDLCPPLNPARPPQRKISKDDFPRPIKPTMGDLRGEKPVLIPSTSTVDPFLINATLMAVSTDVPTRPVLAPSFSVDVPQRKVGVVMAPSVPARPLPHPQSAPILADAACPSFAPPVPRRLSPATDMGFGAQQVPMNPFLIKPADDPFADSFFR